MKKRVNHSREDHLILVFLAVFFLSGYLINYPAPDLTGMFEAEPSCKLVENPFSNSEYCEGQYNSKHCVWVPELNNCKFVNNVNSCIANNLGYCSKPSEDCVQLPSGNYGCIGI